MCSFWFPEGYGLLKVQGAPVNWPVYFENLVPLQAGVNDLTNSYLTKYCRVLCSTMPELQKKISYPIAAKLTGPGPGCYFLPTGVGFPGHSIKLKRWPAYTMRMQFKMNETVRSPGPAAYGYPSKLVNTGIIHEPAYFLGLRLADLKHDATPGPGTFATPGNQLWHRSPAWAMALPAPQDKPNNFPAPNAYEIPKFLGARSPYIQNGPCYSMRIKLEIGGFTHDFTHSPGANTYTPVDLEKIKIRAPAYTMKDRRRILQGINVPGPATYSPTLANRTKSPAFSLGIRHSPYLAIFKVPEPDILLDWD